MKITIRYTAPYVWGWCTKDALSYLSIYLKSQNIFFKKCTGRRQTIWRLFVRTAKNGQKWFRYRKQWQFRINNMNFTGLIIHLQLIWFGKSKICLKRRCTLKKSQLFPTSIFIGFKIFCLLILDRNGICNSQFSKYFRDASMHKNMWLNQKKGSDFWWNGNIVRFWSGRINNLSKIIDFFLFSVNISTTSSLTYTQT